MQTKSKRVSLTETRLAQALCEFIENYIDLIASGDVCTPYDTEKDAIVIEGRHALRMYRTKRYGKRKALEIEQSEIRPFELEEWKWKKQND